MVCVGVMGRDRVRTRARNIVWVRARVWFRVRARVRIRARFRFIEKLRV
jgi:hypothetical protein